MTVNSAPKIKPRSLGELVWEYMDKLKDPDGSRHLSLICTKEFHKAIKSHILKDEKLKETTPGMPDVMMACIIYPFLNKKEKKLQFDLATLVQQCSKIGAGGGIIGDGGTRDMLISCLETLIDTTHDAQTIQHLNNQITSRWLKNEILGAPTYLSQLFPKRQAIDIWSMTSIERVLALYLQTSRGNKPFLREVNGADLVRKMQTGGISEQMVSLFSTLILDPTFDPAINIGALIVIHHCDQQGMDISSEVWKTLNERPFKQTQLDLIPGLEARIQEAYLQSSTQPISNVSKHNRL